MKSTPRAFYTAFGARSTVIGDEREAFGDAVATHGR